jgi:S-adenosylmethionine/arginine decarboxylase-like enzyme
MYDLRDGETAFGWHAVINLRECDASRLDSESEIANWVTGLVIEIGMKAYGDPRIDHFGHADPVTAGYTCVQLIETSSITAHFSPYLRTAYVDVFSCQEFDVRQAARFTQQAFRAGSANVLWIER